MQINLNLKYNLFLKLIEINLNLKFKIYLIFLPKYDRCI